MTLDVWWAKLRRLLSGRDGIDRRTERHELQPLELPEIEPADMTSDGRTREKEHLERGKREREMELARLRAIAQGRVSRRDA